MRTISAALREHLAQNVTTTCRLLRFILADGRVFGLASLDIDVTYDGVLYQSAVGFDSSVIATDVGLSVDNSEGYALLATDGLGITLDMVTAGVMDNALWQMLLVNYRDLSMGHMILDAGDTGQVRTENSIAYMPELLSFVMRLKQSIGTVDSRTCRAIFGTPPNTQTGCGVNAEALWRPGTVATVSATEKRRIFAAPGIELSGPAIPGRIRFTSGRNSSLARLYQIEGYGPTTGTIALLESVSFDIEPGDTFDIRPDCGKTPAACTYYNNFINYKGEPLIPIGDGVALLTPSAQLTGSFIGSEILE